MEVKFKMLLNKLGILIFILAVSSANLFSQGMNNDYPIDSTDIKNVMNMLGIEMFKFPIQKQAEKCNLRIIMEEFENHKSISKSVLTNGVPKDCLELDGKSKTLRIYKQNVNDSTIGIRVDLEGMNISTQVGIDRDTIGIQMCRGYSDFQPEKGKTVPVFIWFAFGKGRTEPVHCPGNSPLQIVAELYDFVIAISLEIEDSDSKHEILDYVLPKVTK
jgi:hypothetical protein